MTETLAPWKHCAPDLAPGAAPTAALHFDPEDA